MNQDSLRVLAERTAEGNLSAFQSLLSLNREWLAVLEETCPALRVTPDAAKHVLKALQQGQTAPQLASEWGHFVRFGFFRGLSQALEIELDPDFEEALLEAASRLDNLGDAIDGEISPELFRRLIESLEDESTT